MGYSDDYILSFSNKRSSTSDPTELYKELATATQLNLDDSIVREKIIIDSPDLAIAYSKTIAGMPWQYNIITNNCQHFTNGTIEFFSKGKRPRFMNDAQWYGLQDLVDNELVKKGILIGNYLMKLL